MDSTKIKRLYGGSIVVGIILIIVGLLLFIPQTTRSDTPEMYYYNITILRLLLPISGVIIILIGTSVYSAFKTLQKEVFILQENYKTLEKKIKKQ